MSLRAHWLRDEWTYRLEAQQPAERGRPTTAHPAEIIIPAGDAQVRSPARPVHPGAWRKPGRMRFPKEHGDPAWLANVNSIDQVVLTGTDAALDRVAELAPAAGAHRAQRIAVVAPSTRRSWNP